jgi:cold shock CspA family protein
VVRVFRDRGYGFVRILGTDDDAFFHFSIVDEELQSKLVDGAVFSADIYRDDVKAGLEVRKLSGE